MRKSDPALTPLDGMALRATSWAFLNLLKNQARFEGIKFSHMNASGAFDDAAKAQAKGTLSHLGMALVTADSFLTPIIFTNSLHPVHTLNKTLDLVVEQAFEAGGEARARKAAERFATRYEPKDSKDLTAEMNKCARMIQDVLKFHAIIPGTLEFESGDKMSPATEIACNIFQNALFQNSVLETARAIELFDRRQPRNIYN